MKKKILVIGANYGLLLAGMLIERGFTVDVFGTNKEIDVLNQEGFAFDSYENSWNFKPSNFLKFISHIEKYDYDLTILAVQEPTLANSKISNVISLISENKIPILSIMNIPLLNFLTNIIGIQNINNAEKIYSSIGCSDQFNSKLIINSNPEPQIFSKNKFNDLSIRLGGVFRCSSLNMLDKETVAALTKTITNGLPTRIKSYESPWVSLSKLPMLLVGNYRCLNNLKLQSIADTVYHDTSLSEKIYDQVVKIMKNLGAGREAIIPFKSYLKASINLDAPSSVCRAIVSGKHHVERADKLVQIMGHSIGFFSAEIDKIVQNIDDSIDKFSNKDI
tara:strand:- start:650 stop:1651 length:1002 start_codon:yes stop_codon:yes gene_type:complete